MKIEIVIKKENMWYDNIELEVENEEHFGLLIDHIVGAEQMIKQLEQ